MARSHGGGWCSTASALAHGLALVAFAYVALGLMSNRFAPTDDPVNHARVVGVEPDHLDYPPWMETDLSLVQPET